MSKLLSHIFVQVELFPSPVFIVILNASCTILGVMEIQLETVRQRKIAASIAVLTPIKE